MVAITLPPDGWVRNFLGGGEPGRFHCMSSFLNIWVPGFKQFHILLHDECQSLLD